MNPLRRLSSFAKVTAFGFLLLSILPTRAAVILVDFGRTNNSLPGYNEITSYSSITNAPLALVDLSGNATAFGLSYSGEVVSNGDNVAGINNTIGRSAATGTAWSALTGGEDIADVNREGRGFKTNGKTGTLTLSGLEIGQSYTIMFLSGASGTGNGGSLLKFEGIDSNYSYTPYDSANVSNASYASETLSFSSYTQSGQSGAILLDFTSTSEDLKISMTGAPYHQAFQGFALIAVPEPSSALLGAFGALLFFLRRKR